MSRFVSFLLKVWVSETLEGSARTAPHTESAMREAWRGQIQHIPSGDVATFTCHEEMLEFIRTHLAADPERAEGETQRRDQKEVNGDAVPGHPDPCTGGVPY